MNNEIDFFLFTHHGKAEREEISESEGMFTTHIAKFTVLAKNIGPMMCRACHEEHNNYSGRRTLQVNG